MNALKTCAIALAALLVGTGLGYFLGTQKTPGVSGAINPFGNPYSVTYEVFPNGTERDVGVGVDLRDYACVVVEVKGPAAELALILTDPQGNLCDTQFIGKNAMIVNRRKRLLSMNRLKEEKKLQTGTYVLVVKITDPEKVIWRKEIELSQNMLTQKNL